MKNKGETFKDSKIFSKIYFFIISVHSEWFHNDAIDRHNKYLLKILKHLVKKNKKIEKENSYELQASFNGNPAFCCVPVLHFFLII